MIDASSFFVVVTCTACEKSGLPEAEVRRRICSGRTDSTRIPDHHLGQPTTTEDDGRVKWTVTRTRKLAPDGVKKVAYVVSAERYAEELNWKGEQCR